MSKPTVAELVAQGWSQETAEILVAPSPEPTWMDGSPAIVPAEADAERHLPMSGGALAVIEALVLGARKAAKAKRATPFDIEPHHGWYLSQLASSDEELLIWIVEDCGAVLGVTEGAARVALPNKSLFRIPSKKASLWLSALMIEHCAEVPSDRGVRRAMAILAERATT